MLSVLNGAGRLSPRSARGWPARLRTMTTAVEQLCEGSMAATPASTATATATAPNHILLQDTTYRVMAASVLVRNPIILRPLSEFESAYEEYRHVLQAERSRGSFDIMTAQRQEMEQLRAEGSAAAKVLPPPYLREQEYEEADGNPLSLMRKLERKLYMVVRNERDSWQFPATYVQNADVPLHRLANKMMKRLVGEECELYCMGYAPVACHTASLPERTVPPLGVKTFFFRSQLVAGKLTFRPDISARSFAWLTKEELKELLPPDYYKQISPILSY